MADPGNSDAGRFLQFNFPIRAVKNLPRMILLFAQFHFRIYSARKSDAIFFATELENDVEFELRDHPATHHVRNSALRVLTPRRGGLASVGPRSAIYVGSARRGAGVPEAASARAAPSRRGRRPRRVDLGRRIRQCRHPAQGSKVRRMREPFDPVFSGFRSARLLDFEIATIAPLALARHRRLKPSSAQRCGLGLAALGPHPT